jgi:hypothetical protein
MKRREEGNWPHVNRNGGCGWRMVEIRRACAAEWDRRAGPFEAQGKQAPPLQGERVADEVVGTSGKDDR